MPKSTTALQPGEPRLIRKEFRWERNFTRMPNAWHQDPNLSMRARGVLGYLMSLKPGTSVTLKTVALNAKGEGIDAIRTAVNELEKLGYLVRHPVHRHGQFVGHDWELCDPADQLGGSELFAALAEPTRTVAASDEPTRTALAEPTPVVRPTTKTLNSPTQGDHLSTRAVEAERPVAATPAPAARPVPTFEPCSRRPYMPCAYTPAGVCVECGGQQLVVDPRTGEVA